MKCIVPACPKTTERRKNRSMCKNHQIFIYGKKSKAGLRLVGGNKRGNPRACLKNTAVLIFNDQSSTFQNEKSISIFSVTFSSFDNMFTSLPGNVCRLCYLHVLHVLYPSLFGNKKNYNSALSDFLSQSQIFNDACNIIRIVYIFINNNH